MILPDRSMNLDLSVDGLSEAESMLCMARAPLTASWNCIRPYAATVTARILIQIETKFGVNPLLFVGRSPHPTLDRTPYAHTVLEGWGFLIYPDRNPMEQNYIHGTGTAGAGDPGVSSGQGSNQVRQFLTKMMHNALMCTYTLPVSTR